jgi:hypothetical protein
MTEIPFAAHGYGAYFALSLLDRCVLFESWLWLWKTFLTFLMGFFLKVSWSERVEEGLATLKCCTDEVSKRLVVSPGKYKVKIVDKDGTSEVELWTTICLSNEKSLFSSTLFHWSTEFLRLLLSHLRACTKESMYVHCMGMKPNTFNGVCGWHSVCNLSLNLALSQSSWLFPPRCPTVETFRRLSHTHLALSHAFLLSVYHHHLTSSSTLTPYK